MRATDEGLLAFRRVATTHARSIAERMSVLSDAELTELQGLTTKLRGTA